jgi:hypothetical protein
MNNPRRKMQSEMAMHTRIGAFKASANVHEHSQLCCSKQNTDAAETVSEQLMLQATSIL